jgi:hypothetical protein
MKGIKDHFTHISSSETYEENLPAISKIKDEIEDYRPCLLYLENMDGTIPHAMVIDGYRYKQFGRTEKFQVHLNLGWYGNENGWYNYSDPVITIGGYDFDNPAIRWVQFYRLSPYFEKYPIGPDYGIVGPEYIFEINATLSRYEQGPIYYKWYWDDGTTSEWLGRYASGEPCIQSHTWKDAGIYHVKVKAKNIDGWESDYSKPLVVYITRSSFLLPILEFLLELIDMIPFLEPLLTPIIELICT